MNIRKIEKDDLNSLIGLYKQFWDETSSLPQMESLFDRLSTNPDYIILCAEVDQKVVGAIMGIVCYELYGNCEPFMLMENLVTDKKYRKIGIAKSLLLELEEIAGNKKCSQILFVTENNRTDAISFYTAMGYKPNSHVGFKKSLKK